MPALTYNGTLEIHTCWCGIRHAIPSELSQALKQSEQQIVYCPLGHQGVSSSHETKRSKQLEAELARERARRDQAEAEAEHQRRVAIGHKGAAAKAKKRAAKGVCPAAGCKRSFVDVARHVATCHPDMQAAPAGA